MSNKIINHLKACGCISWDKEAGEVYLREWHGDHCHIFECDFHNGLPVPTEDMAVCLRKMWDESTKATALALANRLHIDGEEMSLCYFFRKAMIALWEQGECFSGKRPLGNSGWQGAISYALHEGEIVDEIDYRLANLVVRRVILGIDA